MKVRDFASACTRRILPICLTSALFCLASISVAEAPENTLPPANCKPVPAIDVSLHSMGGNTWQIYVTNRKPSNEVKVWLWSQTTQGFVAKQLVWEGPLADDEGRTFRVPYLPALNAVRVWACIEEMATASPTRNFATVEMQQKSVLDPGVLHTDPHSGQQVWEYTGSFGEAK